MKKQCSMEEWIRVGLLMKEVDQKLLEVTRMLGGKASLATIGKVVQLRQVRVNKVRSHLEDVMFKQHPGPTGDRLSVFYGVSESKVDERDAA